MNGYDNGPGFQSGQVSDAPRQVFTPSRSSRHSKPSAYNQGLQHGQPHTVGQTYVIQEDVQSEYSQPGEQPPASQPVTNRRPL